MYLLKTYFTDKIKYTISPMHNRMYYNDKTTDVCAKHHCISMFCVCITKHLDYVSVRV